jgi:conjugal transfer pilus assembly protein TraV
MKARLFRLLPLALAISGCSSMMTGLDGQGSFSCKAPDGISCASLSGVYANAVQNNLPGQRPQTTASKSADGGQVSARLTKNSLQAGDPLRSAQKVRRVWLAPWEDEDEVLHDQSYFYMVVDAGRWQIEHSRRQASERYRPVMAPRTFTPQAPESGERQSLQMDRAAPILPSQSSSPLLSPPPRQAGGTSGVQE